MKHEADAPATAAPFTVSLLSMNPAISDFRERPLQPDHEGYGNCSTCKISAVEAVRLDGVDYVKVTLEALMVYAGKLPSAGLIEYTPDAEQNNRPVFWEKGRRDFIVKSFEHVAQGETISVDAYFPAGDYSDIKVTFGRDQSDLERDTGCPIKIECPGELRSGSAVIHFEK